MSAVSSTSSSDGASVARLQHVERLDLRLRGVALGRTAARRRRGFCACAAVANRTARRRHEARAAGVASSPDSTKRSRRLAALPLCQARRPWSPPPSPGIARALARPRPRRCRRAARHVALVLGFGGGARRSRPSGASTDTAAAWLTLAVQLGFVAGTLVERLGEPAGRLRDAASLRRVRVARRRRQRRTGARRARSGRRPWSLRFLTGFFLAGVYPPGMKILATGSGAGGARPSASSSAASRSARRSRTSSTRSGSSAWRVNVLVVSASRSRAARSCCSSSATDRTPTPAAPFDASQIAKVFGNRGVRLADFGYFGHMWELYAMWTWVPVFLRASFAAQGARPALAEGGGVPRHRQRRRRLRGGGAARRPGRPDRGDVVGDGRSAARAALGIGFSSTRRRRRPARVAAVWGAAVVADSAQFSACVTELGDPRYMGTALTIQTCIGFLLTMVSIELVPRRRHGRRLALGLRRARPGPRPRRRRDAAPARPARGREDRARTAVAAALRASEERVDQERRHLRRG